MAHREPWTCTLAHQVQVGVTTVRPSTRTFCERRLMVNQPIYDFEMVRVVLVKNRMHYKLQYFAYMGDLSVCMSTGCLLCHSTGLLYSFNTHGWSSSCLTVRRRLGSTYRPHGGRTTGEMQQSNINKENIIARKPQWNKYSDKYLENLNEIANNKCNEFFLIHCREKKEMYCKTMCVPATSGWGAGHCQVTTNEDYHIYPSEGKGKNPHLRNQTNKNQKKNVLYNNNKLCIFLLHYVVEDTHCWRKQWQPRVKVEGGSAPHRDLPVEDHAVVVVEGQVSTEEGEEQHPHAPHVSLGRGGDATDQRHRGAPPNTAMSYSADTLTPSEVQI